MAIAVLSALSHPHPATATINLKGKKLAGAFFISPWVTFEITAPSMAANADKDYLNRDAAKSMSGMFLGEAEEDSYNTPLRASAEWWEDFKVGDLCIMGAEYEMFF